MAYRKGAHSAIFCIELSVFMRTFLRPHAAYLSNKNKRAKTVLFILTIIQFLSSFLRFEKFFYSTAITLAFARRNKCYLLSIWSNSR